MNVKVLTLFLSLPFHALSFHALSFPTLAQTMRHDTHTTLPSHCSRTYTTYTIHSHPHSNIFSQIPTLFHSLTIPRIHNSDTSPPLQPSLTYTTTNRLLIIGLSRPMPSGDLFGRFQGRFLARHPQWDRDQRTSLDGPSRHQRCVTQGVLSNLRIFKLALVTLSLQTKWASKHQQ